MSFSFHLCHVVLLLGLGAVRALGQTPVWQWARSAGGEAQDIVWATSSDPNGNVLVTGSFQSAQCTFGTVALENYENNYYADLFIAKYDANGQLLWVQSAGGQGDDLGLAVCSGPSSELYVAGVFTDSLSLGDTTLVGQGSEDVFMAKLDPNGTFLWVRSIGDMGLQRANEIALDGDGNIALAGMFYFDLIIGADTLHDAGVVPGAAYVAKFDPGGEALWARSADGDLSDGASDVAFDSNGNVIVTGRFSSDSLHFGPISLINAHASSYDLFIAKYDPAGNLLWAKSAGGPLNEFADHVATASDGSIWMSGDFSSDTLDLGGSQLLEVSSSSGYDVFLAKYDAGGSVIWAGGIGDAGSEHSTGLVVDMSDKVLMGGTTGSIVLQTSSTVLSGNGGTDAFFIQYDQTGSELWATNIGGPFADHCRDITVDPSGDPIVAGSFASDPLSFGSAWLSSAGDADAFVAKLGTAVSVPANGAGDQHLKVTRNGEFVTVATAQAMMHLKVFDGAGRLIIDRSPSGHTSTFILEPPGFYVVEVVALGSMSVLRRKLSY